MPRQAALLLFAVAAAASHAAPGQSPSAFHKEIIEQVRSAKTGPVLTLLEELRNREPVVFASNGYAYLAGRMAEKQGDLGRAAAYYAQAAESSSPTRVYALWRLSKILRRSGNLPAERLFLLETAVADGGSAAGAAAAERLPKSWYESGDSPSVLAHLPEFGWSEDVSGREDSLRSVPSRDAVLLMGKAAAALGRKQLAEESFRKVVVSVPDPTQPDDLALAAVEGLDQLASGNPLSVEEHFLRAGIYQFNRRFRDARRHFLSIFEKEPTGSRTSASLLAVGKGFSQERDYHNAVEWFERVLGEFPGGPDSEEALYRSASAYASLRKKREASRRFEEFIGEYPDSERVPAAYLNLIDLYRDAGEPGEALKWTEEMRTALTGAEDLSAALFARARIHFSNIDWRSALAALDEMARYGKGTGIKGEAEFMRAYSLEQLDRGTEAVDAYLEIPDGRGNYYGWRATERLRALADEQTNSTAISGRFEAYKSAALVPVTKENARRVKEAATRALRFGPDREDRLLLIEALKGAYSRLPEYTVPSEEPNPDTERTIVRLRPAVGTARDQRSVGEELLFLGAFDEGAVEFELSFRETDHSEVPPDRKDEMLAEYYRLGGLVRRSVALAEGRWRTVPDDLEVRTVPAEDLRRLYPAPFREFLLEYSKAEGLDPRFTLSIMRQESRFDPDAKSVSAARGLMQFIPSTGSKIAGELGLDDFTQDDLYDPRTAIRIGSRYLSVLFRDFPSQPAAVAAGFNAGEDRMFNWYARSHSSEADRYVPEIRFGQTRDYVYKVMSNYRMYRLLYREDLIPIDAEE